MFNPFLFARNVFNDFFGNFFALSGRLNRVSFVTVFIMLVAFFANFVPFLSMLGFRERLMVDVMNFYVFTVLTLMFFASIRRVHDVGFPAASLLVFFFPHFGWLLGLMLLLMSGEPRRNRFGEPDNNAGFTGMFQFPGRFER